MDPKNLDLKQTLNLPRTNFDMKANLPVARLAHTAVALGSTLASPCELTPIGDIDVIAKKQARGGLHH